MDSFFKMLGDQARYDGPEGFVVFIGSYTVAKSCFPSSAVTTHDLESTEIQSFHFARSPPKANSCIVVASTLT